jgi:hypothetical protein
MELARWPLISLAIRGFNARPYPENKRRLLVATMPILNCALLSREIALLWNLMPYSLDQNFALRRARSEGASTSAKIPSDATGTSITCLENLAVSGFAPTAPVSPTNSGK